MRLSKKIDSHPENKCILYESVIMSTRRSNIEKIDRLYAIVLQKSNKLLIDYCTFNGHSDINMDYLKRLSKKKIKNMSTDIEDFITSILELAEQNIENFDFVTFCPPTDEPKPYCHMQSDKRTRRGHQKPLRCVIPFHFNSNDQWPKGFIPQIYHILQDYGLFYIYLGVEPRSMSLIDLKSEILYNITVSTERILSTNPHDTYNSRISFLDKLSLRLQYVKFLRTFYLKCCSYAEEDSGKRMFRETLEGFESAINRNRRGQLDMLEKLTSPRSLDSESDSDSE